MSFIDAFETRLDRVGRWLMQWWVWPASLLFMGSLALLLSWVCYPVGNDVHVFGVDLMGECVNRAQWGYPCSSCGMTRSWVWAARGQWVEAARYNVAGLLLYGGLLAGGLVGAVRLVRRNPNWLGVRWVWIPVLIVLWFLFNTGTWGLRLAGYYPLPHEDGADEYGLVKDDADE